MKIIVVAMLYGFSMPIFLLTTVLVLIADYIISKLLFAYFCSKPPMLDKTLHDNALYFIKWGALLYIGFGFWSLTNR